MSATERAGATGGARGAPGSETGPVLLLCTTTRDCPRTLEAALQVARGGGRELLALFVLDPALLQATASLLSQAGFDATERSAEALEPAYRSRAEARLGEIRRAALEAGLQVRTELREGSFTDQLEALLGEEGPSRVICARKRRSHYARLVFEQGLLEPLRGSVPLDEVEET
ncbi:MAG: universal stress protein [Deltaproteobacteria bacterium]|nr:universal stress protein [Deltaproteobacteria bacterium]